VITSFTQIQVCRLLRTAVEARDILAASASKFNEGAYKSQSFFQWFQGNPSPSQMAIQNANERTKAANQLEYGKNQFSAFFDVKFFIMRIFLDTEYFITSSTDSRLIKSFWLNYLDPHSLFHEVFQTYLMSLSN